MTNEHTPGGSNNLADYAALMTKILEDCDGDFEKLRLKLKELSIQVILNSAIEGIFKLFAQEESIDVISVDSWLDGNKAGDDACAVAVLEHKIVPGILAVDWPDGRAQITVAVSMNVKEADESQTAK